MVLATLAIASTTPAQAVRGRVYDLETGAGVSGAEVALWRMTKPAATVRTDSTGYFMIALSDTGSYELVSRRIGYFGGGIEGLRIARRDTFELIVRMERLAQVLEALKIEGKKAGLDFARGFDERREKGIGYFVTHEDIERKGFQRATELVYGVPGFQIMVDPRAEGLQISRIVSTRASGLGACEPALFVDGIQVDAETLYRDFSSTQIDAIEVYHASQVPGRFMTGRSLCGVVLFWTKSRAGKGDD